MGGKYEIIGKKYDSPCEDIHIFTNKLSEALKIIWNKTVLI